MHAWKETNLTLIQVGYALEPNIRKEMDEKKTVKTMQARVNYYALFDNKITSFGFLYEAMVDEGEKIESE